MGYVFIIRVSYVCGMGYYVWFRFELYLIDWDRIFFELFGRVVKEILIKFNWILLLKIMDNGNWMG